MKIDENGVLYKLEPQDVVDGTLVIPEGVKKIGCKLGGKYETITENGYAYFNLFIEIKNIQLPNSLIEICDKCFEGLRYIDRIILPDSVTKIGKRCFMNCVNAKQIRLSRKLEEIPAESFFGCELEHLIIPDSVHTIDTNAFADYDYADSVIYSKINYFRFPQKMEKANIYLLNNVGSTQGKKNIILPKEVDRLYMNHKKPSDEIVMPNKFEGDRIIANYIDNDPSKIKFRNKIGSKRYQKYIKNIKNENVPIGRREIGMSDVGQSGLQSSKIVIKGVDVISEFAFSECQNLEEVVIAEGVKSIERGAFAFCPNLRRIELPKSLEYIGSRAFWGCEKLERNSSKIWFR